MGSAATFGSVASPSAVWAPEVALAATRTWVGAADPAGGLTSGEIIARYAVIDVVFASTLAGLLGLGLAPRAHATAVGRAAAPALAYLAADWGETLYLAWVWSRAQDGPVLLGPSVASTALVGMLSTLKWAALAVCLLRIARRRFRRAGRTERRRQQ